jgi:glucokinase
VIHRDLIAPPAVVAVDIGGTKIAAALVDDTGRIRERARVGTPRGAPAILDTVTDLVAGMRARADRHGLVVTAAGVGAPGVIDVSTGVVRSATAIVPGWAGTPVRAELSYRTGLPIAVVNDVRAAAVGAAQDPAARGFAEVLHVSVGTGVGGAVLRNGRLVSGPHGSAGELGHLLVPATGAIACGCGRYNHLEALVAGPAIAATYAQRLGIEPVPLTEVVQRMRDGDQHAWEVVQSAADLLGRALAGLVAAVDADAITLGGGVVFSTTDFADTVREAFRDEALAPVRSVPVLVPDLALDAPLLGAARLAWDLTTTTTQHSNGRPQ